ncbi:IclR family transcriptional regulator [Pasteurella skyensis]|uniref:IclR family transcriptional regulator n=1 Tax=Phocoenobacter skyensis TaxID=97481 RepID=A0AAJ6N999_9PAST|nr:IclR family transcriptional regulator [Pasteurella skyensis]MDP8162830.1 IclR family transcriptional regulator [Pasteurella skyensis]MDP8172583.1 IclR family transcriptional regulator [Pasteurella skyensis]MDP8179083.1 IclR family transcriptional regulator [Pasteurella skyensis]MDP8183232.1 IclR family transcriptional regulator [Pasteurella skyensis]MDP8189283.1 IclR family transcriptional regulator [Pasteurella skyensis]
MKEKTNTTQRALRIVKALKGKSLVGLSNKELADTLDESPVNITRAVANLVTEGFVTQLETGRYALSVQLLQIAVAHTRELQVANDRITQLGQRVQAGSFN